GGIRAERGHAVRVAPSAKPGGALAHGGSEVRSRELLVRVGESRGAEERCLLKERAAERAADVFHLGREVRVALVAQHTAGAPELPLPLRERRWVLLLRSEWVIESWRG